jgi:hypothetical protein
MSKHTPGPWGIKGAMIMASQNRDIAWLSKVDTEANARLISVAPDLLAVCKEMEMWIRRHSPSDDWPIECTRASRIIATAEGC